MTHLKRFVAGLLFVTTAAAVSSIARADETAAAAPKKIRWILAHEPIDIFERAAKQFAAEVSDKTHGQLQVEILTLKQYGDKYANGMTPSAHDVMDLMQEGQAEMSQMYTTSLGALNRDLYVLDLPFLFRDYKQAEKVFEGKIGQTLLASFDKYSDIRGLAFTYSGGYRVIPGTKPINSVADMRGLTVRTSESPVAQDTLLAVGAKPVVLALENVGTATRTGRIQEAESTFVRIYGMHQNEFSTYVNDTAHSLFVTSIIADGKFIKSLDAKTQEIVKTAAMNAARTERTTAIREADVAKDKCTADGLKVVTLSNAEREKFKKQTRPLYDKYKNYFSENFIGEIEAIQ